MQIVFDAAPIHLSPSLPFHSPLTPLSLPSHSPFTPLIPHSSFITPHFLSPASRDLVDLDFVYAPSSRHSSIKLGSALDFRSSVDFLFLNQN